jgi:hypothetical protein
MNYFDFDEFSNVPAEEDSISNNRYREKKGGLPW